MKKILFVILYVVALTSYGYSNKEFVGNTHYNNGGYEEAIEEYLLLINTGTSTYETWYNLGNAYFKNNQIGFAIAAYRKALKLKPNDGDIEYNLSVAFSKTKDKIQPSQKNVLISTTDSIANIFHTGTWAFLCLLFAAFGITFFVIYIFSKKYNRKKYSLIISMLCWIGSFSFLALAAHKYYYAQPSEVVITEQAVMVMDRPGKGLNVAFLGEGATLELIGTEGDYVKVKLPENIKYEINEGITIETGEGYIPIEFVQIL